jgi:hypothetical protein
MDERRGEETNEKSRARARALCQRQLLRLRRLARVGREVTERFADLVKPTPLSRASRGHARGTTTVALRGARTLQAPAFRLDASQRVGA